MIGRVVGSYRIVEKIGEGGMGAVYRAVDEMLEREVAIKAIRPDLAREPQIVERFRAEAKILARVSHPAIATIYSFFHDGDDLFLAMEYVRGRTLAQVLGTEGAMPWPRAVMLLATALEGIEQAHRAGIVHRDLKPDNLMVTSASPEGILKVMDFGIARMAGSSHLTQTGLMVGTLRYIAPEQIRGEEVDRRTDVYSLGAVLYQMITGRVPFDAQSDFAILKAQLEDTPPPPVSLAPAIPDWLDRAILRALEKDPAARFQTVEEMRTVLVRQGMQGLQGIATPVPLPRQPDDEEPTMVLPPRTTLAGVTIGRTGVSARPSLTTTATDRPLLSQAPPPPLPPSTAAGTSYRPVEAAGWKKGAFAAIAGIVLLLLALFAWRFFQPTKPAETNLATTPTSPTTLAAAPAPSPSTSAPPSLEPTPTVQTPVRREPAVVSPQSPRVSTPTRTPIPEPAAPPVSTPQETHPAEPTSEEPAPEPAPSVPLTGELPYEELRRVSSELVAESEKLGETYGDFLDKKEDGGAELTDTDNQLKDELEALTDAATRLNKRFSENFFTRLTRSRLSNPENRIEIAKRLQALADTARRVDHLMGQVQPSPEVRQGWGELRRRWVRVGELMRGR